MVCPGHDRMTVGFVAPCAISAYHQSSSPVQGDMYSIQQNVIKLVSD